MEDIMSFLWQRTYPYICQAARLSKDKKNAEDRPSRQTTKHCFCLPSSPAAFIRACEHTCCMQARTCAFPSKPKVPDFRLPSSVSCSIELNFFPRREPSSSRHTPGRGAPSYPPLAARFVHHSRPPYISCPQASSRSSLR